MNTQRNENLTCVSSYKIA